MLTLILIPILTSLMVQAIKLATDGIPKNFTWEHLLKDYGGMPSGHSAFVAALCTIVGLQLGFNSAGFAISFALLVVVTRDAVGFRREIGRNAVLTNLVAKKALGKLPAGQNYLAESIGHTPLEVVVGLIIGSALAVLLYFSYLLLF